MSTPPSTVRPAFRQLKSTWDPAYIAAIRAHYSGSRGPPPGKKMAWEVGEQDPVTGTIQHRGWIGLGEPAYKLAPRRRLGLDDARPLPRTVMNSIYRIDAPGVLRASTLLKAWHDVAADDWAARYGWRPEHWETLVDPAEVQGEGPGYTFRRAGYRSLGLTTGRSARRPAGSTHSARVWSDSTPKLVLYRGSLARVDG